MHTLLRITSLGIVGERYMFVANIIMDECVDFRKIYLTVLHHKADYILTEDERGMCKG